MEVRSMYFYRFLDQRIALGNSNSGLVEGYATVKAIIPFSFSEITKYETQHRATEWLKEHLNGRKTLYGFVLFNVKKEKKPFPYPKSKGVTFKLD